MRAAPECETVQRIAAPKPIGFRLLMPSPRQKSNPDARRAADGSLRRSVSSIDSIAALAWAGRQQDAIDACTHALQDPQSASETRFELLDIRAESFIALGRFSDAKRDAEAMQSQAGPLGVVASARAACRLALVQTHLGDHSSARASARQALQLARSTSDLWLEGLALFRLSEATWRDRDVAGGLSAAQEATKKFESAGDAMWTGRALWSQSCALATLGRTGERTRAAQRAVALAEQSGDRAGLGGALNMLLREQPDMALRLRGLQQSIDAFGAAGYTERQLGIRHNLSIAYGSLGLYRRARRMALAVVGAERENRTTTSMGLSVLILAWYEAKLHNVEAARHWIAELARINRTVHDPYFAGFEHYASADLALLEGDGEHARRSAEAAVRIYRSYPETTFLIAALASLAKAWLQLGKSARALTASQEAIELLQARETPALAGALSPVEIWEVHARALQANGREREAGEPLAAAYRFLCANVANLSDAGLRRSFFARVESHRKLLEVLRTRGDRPRRWPHLRAEASLREPFERLAEGGLRLNELGSEAEVLDFLVEEATELSGAERVLVVLDAAGALRIAGAALPPREDEQALVTAITPWLQEARRTHAVRLRHGPEGVAEIDQRSCLVAPLLAGRELLGFLYADIEGLYGRFGDTDRDLLAMLAGQAAVALANARFTEGLEHKVAERTAQLEQRASELALINSVQEGIAAELSYQAIIDLVGDKLRALFATGNLSISSVDESAGRLQILYAYEHGARLQQQSFDLSEVAAGRRWFKAVKAHQAVVWSSRDEYRGWELFVVPGTDMSRSGVAIPIFAGDRLSGYIALENHESDAAYDEADVRLLSTVAASTGAALENARLFGEIQRRGRESSALADVGRDLSSSLDLSAVLNGIARHAKELLGAENSAIFLPAADGGTFRADVAHGDNAAKIKATVIEPGRGIIGSLLKTGQPELINKTAADPRAVQVSGTDRGDDERLMAVPLLSGDQVQGAMVVWRMGGKPFEALDLEFLVGLSLQAAVALNNARLFDETRTSLEQQTATAEVLKVISSSVADTAPVFEKILDSCERLFGTDQLNLFLVGEDKVVRSVARRGTVVENVTHTEGLPLEQSVTGYVLRKRRTLHVPSAKSVPDMAPHMRELIERSGDLSAAYVPLLWEDRGVGSLCVIRQPPRPFTDKELALLRTFADQAVIAIQNARLFNETKEALEQQRASAEVLSVISSSVQDTAPVFDRILSSCGHLFGGKVHMGINLVGDDGLLHQSAYGGPGRMAASEVYPLPSTTERLGVVGGSAADPLSGCRSGRRSGEHAPRLPGGRLQGCDLRSAALGGKGDRRDLRRLATTSAHSRTRNSRC